MVNVTEDRITDRRQGGPAGGRNGGRVDMPSSKSTGEVRQERVATRAFSSKLELEARVAAGKLARECIELCEGLLSGAEHGSLAGIEHNHFWQTMVGQAQQRLPQSEDAAAGAMSDDEARRFELLNVPFGQYRGQPVRDVPPNYGPVITEGDFNRNLRRYMASRHFQRLIADLDDDHISEVSSPRKRVCVGVCLISRSEHKLQEGAG